MDHRTRNQLCLVLLPLFAVLGHTAAQDRNTIEKWADDIGEELWKLNQIVTQPSDFREQYKLKNAVVEEKDGMTLLNSVSDRVARFLKWKIDAVQCIKTAAEDIAEQFEYEGFENFSYYSTKHSLINGEEPEEFRDDPLYEPMYLSPDPQFYSIPVNTSHSAVHVPTNVYDKAPNVMSNIQWSQKLDEVFEKNRRSDPQLLWQYFAASSGFLRHYPAMHWNQYPDLYDCRTRPWYIEAATCSKDVVILMDTTGSMTGMRHSISKLTVNTILDTLSNNDFVSVLNFSSHATEIVPCFKDILVQATPENLNTFRQAVDELELEGYANFSQVFIQAFKILEKQRETRGCGDLGTSCNQAIMLVTDGVAGNITEVFEKYNRQNNGTTIPVRVFTFLVGKEVTKIMEIMWMACLNRGFYAHIHSLEEVREQVFKYIPVIARPLVLQHVVHPIVWTHAYADISDPKLSKWLWDVMESGEIQISKLSKHFQLKDKHFSPQEEDSAYAQKIFKIWKPPPTLLSTAKNFLTSLDVVELINSAYKFREPDKLRFQEFKLLTSVSIPAFNRKLDYEFENYTDTPDLLGIAGTDIPIEEIEELTLPYHVGVNGYVFIVTNNGYLILHPDLRPVVHGKLNPSYNSVDLTEVELMEESLARDLSDEILELREAMVNHSEGQILGLKLKFHYDDMRRTFVEKRDYYYGPLKGTPFSIAISLPQGYGYRQMKVGKEVKKTQMEGKHLDEFFQGKNWRIYSKWVYCRYYYNEYHRFLTPEEELLHFLDKMNDPEFKFQDQYKPDYDEYEVDDGTGANDGFIEMTSYHESKFCNKQDIHQDDYFCNEDLLNMLVFDAKVANATFGQGWAPKNEEEEELVKFYNATLRYVASQSGLIKWQHMFGGNDENDTVTFGDVYHDGIYEALYKSAVVQSQIDPESLFVSVPYDAGSEENPLITTSFAVYAQDGVLEAPAAVTGMQFDHAALYEKFTRVTADCPGCEYNCAAEEWDCYILDNNGYIVVSEIFNDTGRFFGEVEGAALEAMMEASIYKKVRIYDYQGLCKDEDGGSSAAAILLTPVRYLQTFVSWLFSELAWIILKSNLHHLWYEIVGANPIDTEVEDYIDYNSSPELETPEEELTEQEEDWIVNATEEEVYFPCDQKTNLYLLTEDSYFDNGYCHTNEHCSRPFCMKRIPHTNLVLVVIDATQQKCLRKLTTAPKTLDYSIANYTHSCRKLKLNNLPRRRLSGCFTEDSRENTKHMCGDCVIIKISSGVLLSSWIVILLQKFVHY